MRRTIEGLTAKLLTNIDLMSVAFCCQGNFSLRIRLTPDPIIRESTVILLSCLGVSHARKRIRNRMATQARSHPLMRNKAGKDVKHD